jgi:hypothetical protein
MTAELLTQRINIRVWRHLMQGFIRYGLGLSDTLDEMDGDDLDDEGLGADQMNHSRATGLAIYGRSVASFQGVRADIQTALISFSQRWHAYLGLSPDQLVLGSLFWDRAFLVPKAEINPSNPTPSGLPKPPMPIALALERPLVEFRHPIRPRATAPAYRVSIGQFNEFMSLYGVPQVATPSPSESGDLDAGQVIRTLAYSPLVPSSQCDIGLLTQVLREFMSDDQATFRSPEQQEAFHLMMKHIPYLFLILPTAAGKTTLFLLGASLFPDQVTIIIIPLISLKLDLLGKADALGLRPTVWDPAIGYRGLNPKTRVILVQIEHVVHPKFYEMAGHLINHRRLSRVIWDECHLIPLSQGYRPIMKRAWHALALQAPIVFASATLPSHLQHELASMLQLPRPYITLRASLALQHMAYRVHALPRSLDQDSYPGYLTQFIKQFETTYKPFGQSDSRWCVPSGPSEAN